MSSDCRLEDLEEAIGGSGEQWTKPSETCFLIIDMVEGQKLLVNYSHCWLTRALPRGRLLFIGNSLQWLSFPPALQAPWPCNR